MNNNFYLKIFLYLYVFVSSLLFLACEEEPDLFIPRPLSTDTLGNRIVSVMNQYYIPSVAACIVKDSAIVWEGYYGYKNLSQKLSTSGNTVYILASISKTFTATAIMQLYEKGLLDLDEDINNYLNFNVRNPNYPDLPVTTRMLLQHRSSLAWPEGEDPEFYSIYKGETAPPLYPWIKEYIVPGGSEYVEGIWKDWSPGSRFGYSNIGGALLGYIVQAVSRKDFADYCIENIFEPLEMFNSGFRISDAMPEDFAILYNNDLSITAPYSVKFYPSTTVWTSVEELSHFLIAMINDGVYKGKRILNEETIDMMLTYNSSSPVGLIWWDRGNNWSGHTGGFIGTSTTFDFNRNKRVGSIILSNTQGNEVVPGGNIYSIIRDKAEEY